MLRRGWPPLGTTTGMVKAVVKAILSFAAGALAVRLCRRYIENEHGRRWVPDMPSAGTGVALMDRLSCEA